MRPYVPLISLLCSITASSAAFATEGPQSEAPPPLLAEQRLPALANAPNLRDLGGYQTQDGRRLKRGLLYRAGALDKLDENEQHQLERLHLARIVDLRSRQEIEDAPDRLPPELLAKRVEMPILAGRIDVRELTRRIHSGDLEGLDLDNLLVEVNRDFVRKDSQVFRDWLHGLLDDRAIPQLFHCTAGKDRTGFAAAILLLTLGVPEATVMQDYLASNRFLEQKNQQALAQLSHASQGRTDPGVLQPLLSVEPRYLEAAFTAMREDHGSVERYLSEALGVDTPLRERLQQTFLE